MLSVFHPQTCNSFVLQTCNVGLGIQVKLKYKSRTFNMARLPSAPEEDNGGSGRDGNPDRHHFSRGAVPRIQRFSCNRGVVDGEPTGSVNSGPAVR
jgi:hypothetical protein